MEAGGVDPDGKRAGETSDRSVSFTNQDGRGGREGGELPELVASVVKFCPFPWDSGLH